MQPPAAPTGPSVSESAVLQRQDRERLASEDAVQALDTNTAVWMHANGATPTASNAARMLLLHDQMEEQRRVGDFDGAVVTWLEINLGTPGAPRIRPTRLERKLAEARMRMYFSGAFDGRSGVGL